jgi:hypothetical protein
MGVFGYGEIISNLGKHESERQVFAADVKGLMPTKEDFRNMLPAVLRGTLLGSALGILPGGGATMSAFAAYTIEKKAKMRPGRGAVRQGQHPRCRRTGGGQQRGLADLLHPAADAGHSAQCGDGADGRRDDDPQHPAGPAGDDQQPGAVLGPDRVDVDRQCDADHPEPAADRHLDQVADRALPLVVSGHRAVLCHRRVFDQQQHLRHLDGRYLRRDRLHLHQAGHRAGAAAAGV